MVVKMTTYTRIMLGYLAVVAAGELCRIYVSLLLPFVLFCLFFSGELVVSVYNFCSVHDTTAAA